MASLQDYRKTPNRLDIYTCALIRCTPRANTRRGVTRKSWTNHRGTTRVQHLYSDATTNPRPTNNRTDEPLRTAKNGESRKNHPLE